MHFLSWSQHRWSSRFFSASIIICMSVVWKCFANFFFISSYSIVLNWKQLLHDGQWSYTPSRTVSVRSTMGEGRKGEGVLGSRRRNPLYGLHNNGVVRTWSAGSNYHRRLYPLCAAHSIHRIAFSSRPLLPPQNEFGGAHHSLFI